jgi:cytochrome P450
MIFCWNPFQILHHKKKSSDCSDLFVIDCLLQNPKMQQCDKVLKENILAMIFASLDTSTFFFATTLLLLAINSDVQDQLYQEIRNAFPNSNSDLNSEVIGKLDLLDRVIKESLRHATPVPFTMRGNLEELEVGKAVLPKNTIIVICNFILNKRPDIWGENFDKFYPDHFLPENDAKRHPYSFAPFGMVI